MAVLVGFQAANAYQHNGGGKHICIEGCSVAGPEVLCCLAPFLVFIEQLPSIFLAELRDVLAADIFHEFDTEILKVLGEECKRDGSLIVYTSADSVLQICGNEETFGLQNLYDICEYAREITMRDEWRVGRIIARPYVGKHRGEFVRTANRHDLALSPTNPTALDALKEAGFDVLSVGKISDIFNTCGITEGVKSKSSVHGMEQTIDACRRDDWKGVCFTNLVDFDALWGHRRNVQGYAQEIVRFDVKLGELLSEMKETDLLMITADHGNDPTYTGTDHTREQVPLLMYSPSMKEGGVLPETDSFAVIGCTIAENFGVEMPEGTIGYSILDKLV